MGRGRLGELGGGVGEGACSLVVEKNGNEQDEWWRQVEAPNPVASVVLRLAARGCPDAAGLGRAIPGVGCGSYSARRQKPW